MQVKFVKKPNPKAEIEDRLFGTHITIGNFSKLTPKENKDSIPEEEHRLTVTKADEDALRYNHTTGLRLKNKEAGQEDVDRPCEALKELARENNIKCLISNEASTSEGLDKKTWFFCGDVVGLIRTAQSKGLALPFSQFAVPKIEAQTKKTFLPIR